MRRSPVYAVVVVFYLVLFGAVMWPIYPRFSSIEPRFLGLPFSLTYIVAILCLSFGVLLGLYLWEGVTGRESPEAAGADPESGR